MLILLFLSYVEQSAVFTIFTHHQININIDIYIFMRQDALVSKDYHIIHLYF